MKPARLRPCRPAKIRSNRGKNGIGAQKGASSLTDQRRVQTSRTLSNLKRHVASIAYILSCNDLAKSDSRRSNQNAWDTPSSYPSKYGLILDLDNAQATSHNGRRTSVFSSCDIRKQWTLAAQKLEIRDFVDQMPTSGAGIRCLTAAQIGKSQCPMTNTLNAGAFQ